MLNITDGTVQWAVKRMGNHIPYSRQMYTTAGTYTFTAPVTGLYKITVVGAGGGSGGAYATTAYGAASGGGGGGGHAIKYVFLFAGDSYIVTVGAGGAAGAATSSSATNGGTGGTSSFGALISATGGGGSISAMVTSSYSYMGKGGTPGVGSGGDINGRGNSGVPATTPNTDNNSGVFPGPGGSSILSGGSSTDGGTGPDGIFGAGAGGADNGSVIGYRAGSKGGDGAVIIEW